MTNIFNYLWGKNRPNGRTLNELQVEQRLGGTVVLLLVKSNNNICTQPCPMREAVEPHVLLRKIRGQALRAVIVQTTDLAASGWFFGWFRSIINSISTCILLTVPFPNKASSIWE